MCNMSRFSNFQINLANALVGLKVQPKTNQTPKISTIIGRPIGYDPSCLPTQGTMHQTFKELSKRKITN